MKAVVHADSGLKAYFIDIYQYVGLNILLCGAVSYFVASNATLFHLIIGTPLLYVVFLAPIVLSVYVSKNFETLSIGAVESIYWAHGVLFGAVISSIFIVYSSEDIFRCFFIAGGIFFSAALYGKITKKDLTSVGSALYIGLIGLIVISVLNYFFNSSALQFALSAATVVIFTGLVAYDMQRLTSIYYSNLNDDVKKKIAILGALQLFLSFINIFLSVLELFGKRKK